MTPSADLQHVEHWIFDLDNTLYPPESEVMALVEGRMTDFMVRQTGLPRDEARALQKRYLSEHGTTLAGLMAFHGVEPMAFLNEVHDVSLDTLHPDPELKAGLLRLPGRRLVFTNGDSRHAERILDKLAIADLFDDVFHLETADFVPKPHPATFRKMMDMHGVDARAAAFFEDSERNLAPATALGMTTILVGPHAADSPVDFVHWRTEKLPPFLHAAQVKEDR